MAPGTISVLAVSVGPPVVPNCRKPPLFITTLLVFTFEVLSVCPTVRLDVTVTFEFRFTKPTKVALLCTIRLEAVKVPAPTVVRFPCRVTFPPVAREPVTFRLFCTVSEFENCASCATVRLPPTVSVDATWVFPVM